jgi:hypothetical protein
MKKSVAKPPAAQTTLHAYPPVPARVELAYQPLPGRLVRTVAALVFFWGAMPYVVWVPPHYPWPIACFLAGAYLAHHAWTGRYRVRSFLGICPRCGLHLRVKAGTSIDLPHTLTCFGCHFEPQLVVDFAPPLARPAAADRGVRHFSAECPGTWRVHWFWDDPYVECRDCGARHFATPEARRAAEEENERGSLLEQLANEGRFLD